ncbi:NAD(P)H-quinone oxidoreductase [Komagataeibacter intermedius]|uniref:NAD(P)H quinone oxidoreductase n=2 Tax=Komagataeibacter intermedius TaxID=66229 RepID=A0A0N1F6V8_9PROT|nr:NAD(P)H-quinone oxidoreductase [Komagataeibacter intermedius]KPH85272.1 NAD(P)H quinone oxidoreductase [Komagataeibacter intermedius AF2]MCF3636608.1 NAD(P)H-quinone oxidoreductase [Komagataeibacter intermedius]GAN86844.1 alcohol dehydrogenase [Komagataeibacter intermedius TF2]GBQ67179.1 zinc-dependent alcohol dehydrogenase [Komagataeibacter intermedius NRIC 0521]
MIQHIPDTMQAITFSQPGGPDSLCISTLPVPRPTGGDVLVRVMAAGVNRPDIMQRQGLYPPPPGASPLLGLEVAGEVVATGPDVPADGFPTIGARVCALVNGGGYARYCTVPAGQCLPWPTGFDAIHAAALPETFFTVWSNLFMTAGLKPGESVLVHGGTSGIGTTAIQLVRAMGGTVYATAGTQDKCTLCTALGATAAINYRTEDFPQRIKDLTDGRGVNAILDMIGGAYLDGNLRSLATAGRLVIIALQGGAKADGVSLARIMTRRLVITGSTLRPRDAAYKATIARQLEERVWPLLARRSIRPIIHATFPFARVADAHKLMENGTHMGKIMLDLQHLPTDTTRR